MKQHIVGLALSSALLLGACGPAPEDTEARQQAVQQEEELRKTQEALAKAQQEAAEAQQEAARLQAAAAKAQEQADAAAAAAAAKAAQAPKPKPKPTPQPAPAPEQAYVAPQPATPAAPPVCMDCGTVTAIDEVKVKGQGSGLGAVAGAVVGGVLGHQFGGGKGKDVATGVGAVAGGVAGHQIERSMKATAYYNVSVRMDDGSTRTIEVTSPSGLSVGSQVRVVGENIQLR